MITKLVVSLFLVFAVAFSLRSQHVLEFNRLYHDRPEEGRFALSVAANGYGVQSSKRHGYGNVALTLHFFIDDDTEFRLTGKYGGNRLSYPDTDVNIYKLLQRSNLESYAFEMGITRQFELSDNALLGFSCDYTYAFKAFNAPVSEEFGVHYISGGAEICFLNLPITAGANYTHVEAPATEDILPQLGAKSFRVWDAYCLVEVPQWRNGNWDKKPIRRFSGTVAIGPTMVFLRSSVAEKADLRERFIPGIRISLRAASRFNLK